MLICLVRGRILGTFANSTAPKLSLNALQCTTGVVAIGNSNSRLNSLTSFISGMVSRNAEDRLKYSASVVLSAVSDCSRDFHKIGHPEYRIMYPERDLAIDG